MVEYINWHLQKFYETCDTEEAFICGVITGIGFTLVMLALLNIVIA